MAVSRMRSIAPLDARTQEIESTLGHLSLQSAPQRLPKEVMLRRHCTALHACNLPLGHSSLHLPTCYSSHRDGPVLHRRRGDRCTTRGGGKSVGLTFEVAVVFTGGSHRASERLCASRVARGWSKSCLSVEKSATVPPAVLGSAVLRMKTYENRHFFLRPP